MASQSELTHHIRMRSQPPGAGTAARSEDYDSKLLAAQEELERIQQKREELERQKRELELLSQRKRDFISQPVVLTEKLTSALTLIDRELFEIRQEAEDLQQCRVCFAAHLEKIQKINPEQWTRENLQERLERAQLAMNVAEEEFDEAAGHFEGSRSGAIFGRASRKAKANHKNNDWSDFLSHLRNGFAFNLPVVLLGSAALIVYLTR